MRIPHLAFIAALAAASAQADITYVDAVEGSSGNAFATGGSLADTSWANLVTNSAASIEDQWMKRTGTTPGNEFGNGRGTVTVTGGSGTVDVQVDNPLSLGLLPPKAVVLTAFTYAPTDGNGNASVQFKLGNAKGATFLRAEAPPLTATASTRAFPCLLLRHQTTNTAHPNHP